MESFFRLKTPKEVFQIIDQFKPLGKETIRIEEALHRILYHDVISPEDLPGFFRSTMDGYAVRAKDTFGASESLPAMLDVTGEVRMGETPDMSLGKGKAVRISTGGMLPEGADGVVMVEYCHLLDESTLEVYRPVSPLENVIPPGDDIKRGMILLKKGHGLRIQDIGIMAGIGKTNVDVHKRPRVAIISTGDEVIPINDSPKPGQVRDINRYTLWSLCRSMGAAPVYVGLSADNFDDLKGMVESGLKQADTVWISGGSSVGTRDITLRVLETLQDFKLLVHGISISPGKPTIIGRSGSKPVIGLPGHVSSALVVAQIFLTRLVLRLSGHTDTSKEVRREIEAVLSRNIESASGREDYIKVKLSCKKGVLTAEPILGKSGLIFPLVEADGMIRVDMNTEGLYQGQGVKVILFDDLQRGGMT